LNTYDSTRRGVVAAKEVGMYWGWGFWGMSVFWWFFWVALIVLFFSFLTPVPRSRARERRETPLDILQRRYANGELTTAEYEERRARLIGDEHAAGETPVRPGAPAGGTPAEHVHH
jgi:putative membrane protein